MKKQIIILLFITIQTSAQNPRSPKIKLSGPCTAELANNYKGKWLITKDESNYNAEVRKRLQQLDEVLHETYPEPTGGDAAWNGHFTKASFADQVKYVMNETSQKVYEEPVKTS